MGDTEDGSNCFYNITDEMTYSNVTNLNDLCVKMQNFSGITFNINNICTVGFTSLESNLDNFLWHEEKILGRTIKNYLYERDVIAWGDSGISIIADQDLREIYEGDGGEILWLEENALATELIGILS